MNQKIELEACPNCGEDAPNAPEMSKVYNGVVICPECGMSGYIEYWQHRPIEDALREENKKLKENIEEANSLLRSAFQIARRNGKETNWEAFKNRINDVLDMGKIK